MSASLLLADLCAIRAPSGAEDELAAVVRDRWRAAGCADVSVDALGTVVARVGGSGPRVLVQAHLDQVGWVVRWVTEDGFVSLDTAQGDRRLGPERRFQVGQPVAVLTRDGTWVDGVVAAASGHVLTAAQREEHRLGWDDFWVELGLGSRAAVEALGVHVGAPVVFSAPVRPVGDLLVGPSMDDRVGLAAIELLLARLAPAPAPRAAPAPAPQAAPAPHAQAGPSLGCELWIAATVQEENGLHGSRALSAAGPWDAAIALEVGLVGDVPGVAEAEHPSRLGAGPIVAHRDAGVAYDRRLTLALVAGAREAGLPVQEAVFSGYRSDGLSLLEGGTPTALVAVPTRYTHTAFEAVMASDVEATAALLESFVRSPPLAARPR